MNAPQSVIWFTGISGSGKTTLARLLAKKAKELGLRYDYLDGDDVRSFFEGDLGYERSDRIINVRRVAFAAKKLADNGILTIVANIAPYYEVRDFIRRKTPNYHQIYCSSHIDTVSERDVQGHYAKFKEGSIKNIIGVDDVYDVPRNPNLIVNTDSETVEESFSKVISYLEEAKVFSKC